MTNRPEPTTDDIDKLRAAADRLSDRTPYWRSFIRLTREQRKTVKSLSHLMGWLRWKGHCVYCGIDLLDSAHTLRHAATSDHLLPKARYKKLDCDPFNIVPACGACSSLKGDFDPNTRAEIPGLNENADGLTPQQQAQLIEAAAKYVDEKIQERNSRFADDLVAWRGALNQLLD